MPPVLRPIYLLPPRSWVNYHLARDAQGPTLGVWPEFAVPESALTLWSLPPTSARPAGFTGAASRVDGSGGCPTALFFTYHRMRELGLPLGADPALDAACRPTLRALWGPRGFAARVAAGHVAEPQLSALGVWPPLVSTADSSSSSSSSNAKGQRAAAEELGAQKVAGAAVVPVAAWRLEGVARSGLRSDAAGVLAMAEAAFDWLRGNIDAFPVVARG